VGAVAAKQSTNWPALAGRFMALAELMAPIELIAQAELHGNAQ